MPEAKVVIGQQHLHLVGIFLDRLVLLLKPLAHALGHGLF